LTVLDWPVAGVSAGGVTNVAYFLAVGTKRGATSVERLAKDLAFRDLSRGALR